MSNYIKQSGDKFYYAIDGYFGSRKYGYIEILPEDHKLNTNELEQSVQEGKRVIFELDYDLTKGAML